MGFFLALLFLVFLLPFVALVFLFFVLFAFLIVDKDEIVGRVPLIPGHVSEKLFDELLQGVVDAARGCSDGDLFAEAKGLAVLPPVGVESPTSR